MECGCGRGILQRSALGHVMTGSIVLFYPVKNAPDNARYRLHPAPTLDVAGAGGTIDCESNGVLRFPIAHQLDALCRQASRIKSRSNSLLRHAEALSCALNVAQEPPQCPTHQMVKSV